MSGVVSDVSVEEPQHGRPIGIRRGLGWGVAPKGVKVVVGARHRVRLVPLKFAAAVLQGVNQGHDLTEHFVELGSFR